MTNLSSPRRSAGFARQLGLAVALASGTALLAVPGFTGAAYAQKKKKDEKGAAKPAYTAEFVKAYQPLETALKAPTPDVAAVKPQLLALAAIAKSPDEKNAVGAMMYNAGILGKDPSLQLQGADTMISSGKLGAEDLGRFNVVASQIAEQQKNYEAARGYMQNAIAANYSAQGVTLADLQIKLSDLYVSEDRTAEGLKVISDAIAAQKAAGGPVDQRLYQRGVKVAYEREAVPQVYDFIQGWVGDFPTTQNWRDAISITRNLNDFEGPILLDLLRLADKVGTLQSKGDYMAYVESASPVYPVEIKAVIKEGIENKVLLAKGDSYIDEQAAKAETAIVADRNGLPALERDANAATAKVSTVLAAANASLSFGNFDKAVTFYQKALGMPGVDKNEVLTRLGMAQIGLGQFDAARDSLGKIEGPRSAVAKLWIAYAAQQAAAATAPAAAPAAAN